MRKLVFLLLTISLLTILCFGKYTDEAQVAEQFAPAVTALSDKNILAGYEDGSFRPKASLNRAQAAKILFFLCGGDLTSAEASAFSDVPDGHWAAGYIGWCAENGFVSGVGKGLYKPTAPLTGLAFGKMLLTAWGMDADANGLVGESWATNTAKLLDKLELTYNVAVSGQPLQRQEACQMIWNYLSLRDSIAASRETILLNQCDAVTPLGGSIQDKDGVHCTYPGSGFSLELEWGGTLRLSYTAEQTAYFTVFTDGERQPVRFCAARGNGTGIAVLSLEQGYHSLRIVQDSPLGKNCEQVLFTAIDVSCNNETLTPAEPAEKSLVVLGGASECGCGLLGTPDSAWTPDLHCASRSYAYLAASRLGWDCTLLCTDEGNRQSLSGLLEKAEDLYGDVWLLSLPAAGDEGEALCSAIREITSKAPVVLIDTDGSGTELVKALGGAAEGFYSCTISAGKSGAVYGETAMASEAEQTANAEILARFLQTL